MIIRAVKKEAKNRMLNIALLQELQDTPIPDAKIGIMLIAFLLALANGHWFYDRNMS